MRKITKCVEYRTNATVIVTGKAREIILGLNPEGKLLTLRLKGKRNARYTYPIEALFHRAVQAAAEALIERRAKVKRGFYDHRIR